MEFIRFDHSIDSISRAIGFPAFRTMTHHCRGCAARRPAGGDQLQVEQGRDAALHLEQRIHGQQARVAGVDMGADGQQALGHGLVAMGVRARSISASAVSSGELAPTRDALEQGAALVDARRAVARRGVHVEVRVAKYGVQQLAGSDPQLRATAQRHSSACTSFGYGQPNGQSFQPGQAALKKI